MRPPCFTTSSPRLLAANAFFSGLLLEEDGIKSSLHTYVQLELVSFKGD